MGWDIDRFPEGEVNLELICCICTCILEDPVESPCRHVFCSQCIKTWLSNQKSCPSCRAPVFKKDLQPVVHILRNMINKQRIYCDNRERGCEELTPLENLASHVASCLYSLVSCSNEGCGIKVMRKDHKAHSEICLKRTVMCDHGCEMFLTLGEKQSHNCIRSLKTHFQDTTNELLSRVSRLEELFNIMVTKPQTYEYNTALIPKTSSSTALGHSSKEAIVCSPYSIPSPPHVGSQRCTLPDVEIAIENPVNLTGYGSDSVDSVESGFLVRYEGRDASPAFDTMRMRGRASERLRLEQPTARHRSRSPFRAVSGQVAARFNLDRDRLSRTSPAYPVNIDDNHHRRTDDESSSDTFSSTTSSESDTD